jgi:protease II
VTDPLYRPHEVWLHRLGTPQDQDVLVFAERDERFELTVRSTRSGAYVLIESASLDTTETLLMPADHASQPPVALEPKTARHRKPADHGDGRPAALRGRDPRVHRGCGGLRRQLRQSLAHSADHCKTL